ncbi:condensin complex subunit 2 [Erpetoichthys calabaricus]|uniref:Condensin complex subunit 2 n=1 Tax=Erpetoichthys calabaricus TaxID=27687 RepID=A0A8C4RC28_ERPCA|nr:condensin complex subunit 2 [Erpetoichthys calabaricus]
MSAVSTPCSQILSEISGNKFVSPSTLRRPISQTSTPVLSDVPSNDDELERKQRRKSRVIDLHLGTDSSVQESPAQRSLSGTPAAVPKLTNSQISEHYSTCIKLSTENKITTKNAFNLHLIDYMSDILKEKDSALTNFKVAAGTLDASAKIYSVRVDAVYANTYRVLGGLGKDSKSADDEENAVLADGQEDGELEKRKTVTKAKKVVRKKMIEQNLSKINRADSKGKCEVDPVFQKMASSFDESSTSGVFFSLLRSFNCYNELQFPTDIILLRSNDIEEFPSIAQVSVPQLKVLLEQTKQQCSICPSLEDFSFMNWTNEANDQSLSEMWEKFKKDDHVFDINAEPEAENEAVDFDFDGDACDANGDEDDLGACTEHREAFAMGNAPKKRDVIPLEDGDISAMCLQLSSKPGEYSYFSPRTMSMWAGPDHWRFKPRHKNENVAGKKQKKLKQAFELNFNEDVNFETYFKQSRAATTIGKSLRDKVSKKRTLLPAEFHYEPCNLTRLNLKPSVMISKKGKKRISGEHVEGIGEYDYNNPNDTANFCPATQMDDDDDDDHHDFGNEPCEIENTCPLASDPTNITTYGEDNLVAEPQKVKKIELNYAKTAKKMDMKRLKETMWCHLADDKEQASMEKENEGNIKILREKFFGSVTKDLQQRLPSTMAQNLSVPLAFAALLHLANEKDLVLQSVEDLSDIIIKQDN